MTKIDLSHDQAMAYFSSVLLTWKAYKANHVARRMFDMPYHEPTFEGFLDYLAKEVARIEAARSVPECDQCPHEGGCGERRCELIEDPTSQEPT